MDNLDLAAQCEERLGATEPLIIELKVKLQNAEALLAETDSKLKISISSNNKLQERINELEKQVELSENNQKDEIETLKQQNHTLKKKLDAQASFEMSMVSEVELLRENTSKDKEMLDALKAEKDAMEAKLLQNTLQIKELEHEVTDLRSKANEAGTARAVPREKSFHEVSGYLDQISTLANEKSELSERTSELKMKLCAAEEELKAAQKQNTLLEKSLEEAQTATEIYKEQSTEYREHLQESKDEIMELRVELEGLKATTSAGGFSEKGNSLFSEVDDERKKLQDIILKQKDSYEAMKEKCKSVSEKATFYKMRLATALNLNATSKEDKMHIQHLKDTLAKSVTQVKLLSKRLDDLEQEAAPVSDNKVGIDSVVETLRNEKSQLEKELRCSKMQYLMSCDEKLQIEYKLKQSEETCNQLRGNIIKLNVQLTENRIETPARPAERKPLTERIPTTPKEEFILNETCSKPVAMKKAHPETKENSVIESTPTELLSDDCFASPKLMKKQKKVAISETVELQYDCGKTERGSVSDDEKQPLKRKGRKVDISTKQIPNEVAPECRQQ